jgi:hypothetical protein
MRVEIDEGLLRDRRIGSTRVLSGSRPTDFPDENHLIVPGQRIGPANLGTNVKDLAAIFDIGDAGDAGDGLMSFLWLSRDFPPVAVMGTLTTECKDWTQDGCRILGIIVVGSEYATVSGLHVGVLQKQVQDILGEPNRIFTSKDSHTHTILYSAGISFIVRDNDKTGEHRVEAIIVRFPNCLKNVPCT